MTRAYAGAASYVSIGLNRTSLDASSIVPVSQVLKSPTSIGTTVRLSWKAGFRLVKPLEQFVAVAVLGEHKVRSKTWPVAGSVHLFQMHARCHG